MNLSGVIENLKRWEGCVPFMYLDVKGYVTCGIGNLLSTEGAAVDLPWRRGGRDATFSELRSDYGRVKSSEAGHSTHYYERLTTCRLTTAAIEELAYDRLTIEFLPDLRRLFPGFDELPGTCKEALIDMAWNLGTGKLAQFTHLREAVTGRNWDKAAGACHRLGVRESRNDWCAEMFLEGRSAT